MPDINLKLFRDQVYHCLGNAKDAVFELTDAVMPMMTWELWLARETMVDNPLPGAKTTG